MINEASSPGASLEQGCRPETHGRIQIEMGALAPKFSEQSIAAHLTPEEIDKFQFISDALTVVIVHDVIPYSAGTNARDKLSKRMFKAMGATPAQKVGTPSSETLSR